MGSSGSTSTGCRCRGEIRTPIGHCACAANWPGDSPINPKGAGLCIGWVRRATDRTLLAALGSEENGLQMCFGGLIRSVVLIDEQGVVAGPSRGTGDAPPDFLL